MEDDTARVDEGSLHHDDRPSAAAQQNMEAKSGTRDQTGEPVLLVEASSRHPQRDNKQQQRPSSSDAGYAGVSGEGSSVGPFAATVEADSHSERPAIAALGHGWPVDDLDSMYDTADENAPLPESLPVPIEAGKHATDDTTSAVGETHDISSRASGHDIGVENSGDGNLERASTSRGDDDSNSCSGASSSGVAVTGDGSGSESGTHGAGAFGAGAGTSAVACAAAGVDADAGPGSVAQTDGVSAFTDAVGSPTAAAAAAAAAVAAPATVAVAAGAGGEETGVIIAGETATVTPPLPPPTPRRTPTTPSAAASAGEHDDWKDYSCATPWEYFVNDVGNAMGALESREAVAAGAVRSGAPADGEGGGFEGRCKELAYLGRPYVLRKLLQRDGCEVSTAGSTHKPNVDARDQEPLNPPYEGLEFAHLVGFLGEEEFSLDALLESEPEQSIGEQELVEQGEAWRLLCSWFSLGDFFCLHESGSATPQSPGMSGPRLSLEQLLSTAVVAMEHRRCTAALAFQPRGDGRRGSERKGVSVKGHAILSHGTTSRWTRLAETVRMESETSSNVPPSRQSLEDFGELLEDKALAAWGRCGEGGRLEASARYTWERRLYDGRSLGEGGDAWQTEWRTRARRERSHRRRGSRDRAVRSLLAATEGEGVVPAWGTEEDPLEGIRVTALWRGLGGERPLPHAPLELVGGPSAGGVAVDWNATVSWEAVSAGAWSDGVARGGREGSLGFKLRLLLAVYVQSLALGGDLLMADVGNTGNEADVTSARERARHIGAVLGPGTRALIAQMRATTQHDQASSGGGGGGGGGGDGDLPGADPAEIVHSARYLLTPRRASLSYRDTLGAGKGGRGWDHSHDRRQQQQQQQQTPTTTPPKETPSRMETPRKEYGHSVPPSPWTPSALGVRSPGFGVPAGVVGGAGTDSGSSVGRTPPRGQCGMGLDGADGGATPWLWVPRGGAPACRLVSQVALEAARFGTHGVCLGDVAAFWKSFVQELRFIWEEGASVPRMDPEPAVDGYSMYDPSATGQDAAGSARLRRHMTAAAAADVSEGGAGNGTATPGRGGSTRGDCKQAAAADEAPTGGIGGGAGDFVRPRSVSSGGTMGGVSGAGGASGAGACSPPPPDMRTCLLHQKLQMLNCCVAEQNKARALALSTRSSSVGLASPSTPGWNAPSVNSGREGGGAAAGAEEEPSRKSAVLELGRAGSAGSPPPTAPGRIETTGISSVDGGGGGGDGGGGGSGVAATAAVPAGSLGSAGKTGSNRNQGGETIGAGPESTDGRDSEKVKAATFAAERDAILRRVGVKKEGDGGGKAPASRWWGLGGRPKETMEPSPTLPPPLRRGGGAGEATRSGGEDGDGAGSKPPADSPRARGKVGGAVMRVGGTLKRVGGVVRKAGGVVHKARRAAREDAAPKKSETPEEDSVERGGGGERVFRDGHGDREAGLKTPAVGARGAWEDHGVAAAAAAAAAAPASMKFTGDRLLVTGEWVLVPELMQPCPLTSDMLEQQMELVRRLSVRAGSNSADADVSRNRVSRLRFATLSADMRCFVRENPGAVFADFVRWYSPRNWLDGSALLHGDAGLEDADEGVKTDGGVAVELFSNASDVEDAMRALVADIVERATGHEVGVLPCANTTTTTAAAAAAADAAVPTPAVVSPTSAVACAPSIPRTADEGATRADGARTLRSLEGAETTEELTKPPVTPLTSVGGGEAGIKAERIPLPPSPPPPPPPPSASRSTPPPTASEVSSSGWKTIIPSRTATSPNALVARAAPDVAAPVVGGFATSDGGSGGAPGGEGARPPDFDRGSSTRASGGEGSEDTGKRSGSPPSSLLPSSLSSSIPSLLGSPPCPRRLDWGRRGKVEWRPTAEATAAAAAAAATATAEDGDVSCGVDETEGAEWMEAWLEVENAAGEEKEGGVCRPRNLFNPAQEAEKALHYLETIGPAQLMSQLLMALACTSGFLLSEAQTDALELPCVQAAVSRVNLAVLSASEGLYEASASGGVLLMGNRVAHPISQATLVACDALCDAVDDAEVLLSRGTSLLHKLPGEYGLVESLVTANSTSGRHNASPARAGELSLSRLGGVGGNGGAATGRRTGDGGLDALVRYLSSGNPSPPFSSPGGSPIPPKDDSEWLQQRHQQGEKRHQQEQEGRQQEQQHHTQEQGHQQEQQRDGLDQVHHQRIGSSGSSGPRANDAGVASELRGENARSSGDNSTRDRTDHHHAAVVRGSNGAPQTTAATAAGAGIATTPTTTPTRGAGTPSSLLSVRNAMPEARVREYSVRWRLPELTNGSVRKMKSTGDGRLPGLAGDPVQKRKTTGEGDDDSDVEGIGARLYARVTVSGSRGSAEGDDEGDVETDVRLAVSIAEPASTYRL